MIELVLPSEVISDVTPLELDQTDFNRDGSGCFGCRGLGVGDGIGGFGLLGGVVILGLPKGEAGYPGWLADMGLSCSGW